MTTQWQRRSSLIPGNSRPLGIVNNYAHGNTISFSSDTAPLLTFLIVVLYRQVLSTHNVLGKTKKLYIISTLRDAVPQKKNTAVETTIVSYINTFSVAIWWFPYKIDVDMHCIESIGQTESTSVLHHIQHLERVQIQLPSP